jgi:hypothetical protein
MFVLYSLLFALPIANSNGIANNKQQWLFFLFFLPVDNWVIIDFPTE